MIESRKVSMIFPKEYSVNDEVVVTFATSSKPGSLDIDGYIGRIESYKADRSKYFIVFDRMPQHNGWYTKKEFYSRKETE